MHQRSARPSTSEGVHRARIEIVSFKTSEEKVAVMLELRNVTKRFAGIVAVDGVSFQPAAGK